jgi:hypothetical protein
MSGKLIFLTLFLVVVFGRAWCQNLLDQRLSLNFTDLPIGQALTEISNRADCRFSYNPDLLPNKNITASFQETSLEEVLKKTLGKSFDYKVRGSYIIIQPVADRQSHKSNIEFVGEVVDARTGRSLANTSVYDVNNLSSTLSGEDGSYKLSTFFQDGLTAFAISKENYKDTVIRIVNQQIAPVKIELQPLEATEETRDRTLRRFIDSLNIVRFLVNRKAKQHIRNVDMVEQRWLQVSFLPVIGTNGVMGGKIGNNVSLNMFAGYNHSVSGVELGGFFNVDRMDVKGFQAGGFGNIVGGQVDGAQLSGFVNLTPSGGTGTQLSGFVNHAGTRYTGLQGTGFVNVANNINGAQLSGFTNFTLLDMNGVQGTGFVNMAGRVRGIQGAGFLNMATAVNGVQASGLINMAGTVKGLQIGILNIAKRVEKGATIGVVNLVKEGFHSFDVSANDITDLNFSFRSGTKHFYTLLTFGVVPQENTIWSMGIGVGTEVDWTEKIYTDFELSTNTVQPMDTWIEDAPSDYRFQVNFGFRLLKWASINAGPVVHFFNYSSDSEALDLSTKFGGRPLFKSSGATSNSKVWVGYTAALRLF